VRIVFLIRSLTPGGAERQVVLLASALRKRGHGVTVLTLYSGGEWENDLRSADVAVRSFGKRSRWDLAGVLPWLVRELRRERPDLVHGYLPVCNLLASTARFFAPGCKVAWGERGSEIDDPRRLGHVVQQMELRLSMLSDLIIANSDAGAAPYRNGRATHVFVIPNGIDTEVFAPAPEARVTARATVGAIGRDQGIANEKILVGMVARIDPMKDHDTFLEAAALAARQREDLLFVCVGGGAPDLEGRLKTKTEELGLARRVIWVGERNDLPFFYNAFDLVTLPSAFGEGFPNAVGEAMACGLPCVVSDVGGSANVVGSTGIVVPARNPAALAEAWIAMLAKLTTSGPAMREAARQRILSHFSLDSLVDRSLAAFRTVVPDIERTEGRETPSTPRKA
jgi:glycosyltransferase involved in cell wall biosynthesis